MIVFKFRGYVKRIPIKCSQERHPMNKTCALDFVQFNIHIKTLVSRVAYILLG